ncbi:MAG: lipid II flippase MurJ [bacterium]|nr:lipid II flippase MurJ [bacterium]
MLSSQRGLHRAAFAIVGATILSQLLALLRDRLLAGIFGVGNELDVYYAAFRVPDLIFVSAASLFSATVVIPFLAERVGTGERAGMLMSSLLRSFLWVMTVVLLVAFAVMPWLAPLVAPGFGADVQHMLIMFSRILLLSPLLLGLSGIIAGATQVYRHFVLFSLTPVVYNCGIIAGIVFLAPSLGVAGVVWGVVLGALAHVLIQVPVVVHHQLIQKGATQVGTVWRVVKTSIPRTIALSLTQIQIAALTAFASLLASGSITTFQLAYNLQSIPLSLVGVSYSVAAFPALALLWAQAAKHDFLKNVRRAEGHIIVWSLLFAALFVLLREQIVGVVLGVGAIQARDVKMIADVMGMFALSLAPQGLVLLYTRAFYAARHTAIPLLAHTMGVATTLVCAYLFLPRFAYPVMVLAGSFSIGMIVTTLILMLFFWLRIGPLSHIHLWLKTLGGVIIGVIVTDIMFSFYARFIDTGSVIGEFAVSFLAGIDGLALAFVYLFVFGAGPAVDIVEMCVRRWRR